MTRVIAGSFDAESEWRPADLASLPAIRDPQTGPVVEAMDEMLWILAGDENDVLATKNPFNAALRDHLGAMGRRFRTTTAPPAGAELVPYAVTPSLVESIRPVNDLPCPRLAGKLNSKSYSTRLSRKLTPEFGGAVVESARVFRDHARERLKVRAEIVVKDPYGVSGAGIVRIDSLQLADRIYRHLRKQESAGKRVELVIEHYHRRAEDYSVELRIEAGGAFEIGSVQTMVNDGFGFRSVEGRAAPLPDPRVYERIAANLHGEGYHGPVCVDSMRCETGEVIPIVEINARWSMGLFNAALDRWMAPEGVRSRISFVPVHLDAPISFENVLEHLERSGLLWRPGKSEGVVPLAAGPLSANSGLHRSPRGRLYISFAGTTGESIDRVSRAFRSALEELPLRISGRFK